LPLNDRKSGNGAQKANVRRKNLKLEVQYQPKPQMIAP
jgi:hypothetical protein